MDRGFLRWRTFFYVMYGVVLTAALLYLRFPTEKFRAFCERKVEAAVAGSDCTIERIGFRPPFSMVFTNLQLVREVDGRRSGLRLDRLAVVPQFPGAGRTFRINGEMYKGTYGMQLAVNSGEKSFELRDMVLSGMNLDEWAADYNLLDRRISGKANATGSYQAGFAAPLAGTGRVELEARDGSVELLQPILSLKSLSFDTVAFTLANDKDVFSITGGKLAGGEMDADFTGEMRLASTVLNSIVILRGHLTPKERFLAVHPGEKRLVEQLLRRYKTAGLPFKVGGTVRRPTFRFSL